MKPASTASVGQDRCTAGLYLAGSSRPPAASAWPSCSISGHAVPPEDQKQRRAPLVPSKAATCIGTLTKLLEDRREAAVVEDDELLKGLALALTGEG